MKIGDIVTLKEKPPVNDLKLSGLHKSTIVASLLPLILVSMEIDTLWTNMRPEGFTVASQAHRELIWNEIQRRSVSFN